MNISTRIEHWPFKKPFRITGHVFDGIDVLVVMAESHGVAGQGEAAGVYYRYETAAGMAAQVEQAVKGIAHLERRDLAAMLPAGGARNALDCALWELESKRAGRPVWSLTQSPQVRALLTTYTLGAEAPGAMAAAALAHAEARALKLKLLGDEADAERVRAVRAARPDVWLSVDANQAFTPDSLHDLLPALLSADVKLVEQPFLIGRNVALGELGSPIPIAADESVQDRDDLARVEGCFDVINIKLDKSGGLTEALAMVTAVRRMGLKLMVGNMTGTSLSAAPGFVLGQHCDFVDLDGPMFLARDRTPGVIYANGLIHCPDEVWGSARCN